MYIVHIKFDVKVKDNNLSYVNLMFDGNIPKITKLYKKSSIYDVNWSTNICLRYLYILI